MKYLVTVVQGITVEAPTPKEAEAHGLALCDGGFAETIAVEVEPLGKRVACPTCLGFGTVMYRSGPGVCRECEGTGAQVEPLGERKPEK